MIIIVVLRFNGPVNNISVIPSCLVEGAEKKNGIGGKKAPTLQLALSDLRTFPVSILHKSIAGRPITARYRFIKNASRVPANSHIDTAGIFLEI